MIARDAVTTLFPITEAPISAIEFENEVKRAARIAERRFNRLSLALAVGLFAMMAIRVAMAWWAGRLG